VASAVGSPILVAATATIPVAGAPPNFDFALFQVDPLTGSATLMPTSPLLPTEAVVAMATGSEKLAFAASVSGSIWKWDGAGWKATPAQPKLGFLTAITVDPETKPHTVFVASLRTVS